MVDNVEAEEPFSVSLATVNCEGEIKIFGEIILYFDIALKTHQLKL